MPKADLRMETSTNLDEIQGHIRTAILQKFMPRFGLSVALKWRPCGILSRLK